ncbi:hypothetical protein C8J57DRAFT_1224462 [Mycena rebaudengoi]|nr:hypothetical protein C8J57DRAFT_1224462 [Mycena rebaudengoi]
MQTPLAVSQRTVSEPRASSAPKSYRDRPARQSSDSSYCRAVIASTPAALARFDEGIGPTRRHSRRGSDGSSCAAIPPRRIPKRPIRGDLLPSGILCGMFALIPVGIGHERVLMDTEEELEEDEINCVLRRTVMESLRAQPVGIFAHYSRRWHDIPLDISSTDPVCISAVVGRLPPLEILEGPFKVTLLSPEGDD